MENQSKCDWLERLWHQFGDDPKYRRKRLGDRIGVGRFTRGQTYIDTTNTWKRLKDNLGTDEASAITRELNNQAAENRFRWKYKHLPNFRKGYLAKAKAFYPKVPGYRKRWLREVLNRNLRSYIQSWLFRKRNPPISLYKTNKRLRRKENPRFRYSTQTGRRLLLNK